MKKAGPLRKLIWLVFGKPTDVLQYEAALAAGVPYEEREFWPALYCFDRTSKPRPWVANKMICPDLYNAKIGDTVPVYWDGPFQYLYEVLGFSWAAGDDHIVSPRQFHIRFASQRALEQTP